MAVRSARGVLMSEGMKALSIAALLLALTGGVASAERVVVRGGGGHSVVVRGGGFHGGGYYHGGGGYYRGGGYYHGGYGFHGYGPGYGRIFMPRPWIGAHYYDYRFRPGLIVEDYPVRDGYLWVRGSWQWNGGEWIWQPGYYEPSAPAPAYAPQPAPDGGYAPDGSY